MLGVGFMEDLCMKLIYLKEGRNYSSDDLRECIKRQLKGDVAWLNSEFLEGLRDSINAEFKKTVVKGTKGSKFVFHYLDKLWIKQGVF